VISLIAGLIFSPHATNFVRPDEYAIQDPEVLESITLYFTRLVLGVQLVLAGVQLPSKYLKTEWKSLALLLGPGMTFMWIVTSLLVFAMVPHINFLQALAVGACVTPTDPVLSNSIVKGKFADKNIPKELQKIVIAESGANDGLGYPFLFLPLYLIMHIGHGGQGSDHSVKNAIGLWFGETWGYTIILSVVYGATVGWIAKELLHWAEERKYVDRESFLVFAITLALFIVGTVGMIGSDDVLACFIAGNTFTWDDWFRLETMDDSFQPTIDMLLNVTIFIWFGAVCPWAEFAHNNVIPIYRLIFLGILVLLLRRPPIVYAMHKYIPQIEQKRQALFVGFFGPIGVSAIFYLYISLEFLRKIKVDGEIREDAAFLMEVMNVVIWFLCICSIVSQHYLQSTSWSGLTSYRSSTASVSPWQSSGSSSPGLYRTLFQSRAVTRTNQNHSTSQELLQTRTQKRDFAGVQEAYAARTHCLSASCASGDQSFHLVMVREVLQGSLRAQTHKHRRLLRHPRFRPALEMMRRLRGARQPITMHLVLSLKFRGRSGSRTHSLL
jgi:NhaP-type Na+/H+ or K+/H+ antiporter